MEKHDYFYHEWTMNEASETALRPLIIYANWFQFGRGEYASRRCVESRMFLWVVRGGGMLRINGDPYRTETGAWYFLPWGHALEYHADPENPFLLGGIHLIPRHLRQSETVFQVAHEPDDDLSGNPNRMDVDLGELNGLIQGRFQSERDRLALLSAYLIQTFEPKIGHLAKLRELARMLLEELALACQQQKARPNPIPAILFRVETFALKHLQRNLRVSDLAAAADCSTATLHRLFRQHHKLSPGQWLARQRAEHAAQLLRTTSLKIHQVAPRVGMEDPFQFSRFFKRMTGSSPKDYRLKAGVF